MVAAYILFALFQLALAFYITYLSLAFFAGAPFVPSSKRAALTMARLAKIKPGDKVYDLGSGDGRLLFLAAAAGATAIGYEINPFLVLYTKLRAYFSPYRNRIRVIWKSFWRADLSDADVIFVYLLPWKMDRLQQMLLSKLKKGTLIISNSFIFKEWDITNHDKEAHVYVFQIPSYQKPSPRRKSS